MEVQQVHTKKKYTMTTQEWESLGKRQKLFTVLDVQSAPANVVTNLAVGKGKTKAGKQGQSQTTKK